tara:strand:+ start:1002 stop:1229 length:228 start_codon:yes stop_codon:yes gene_type:complete
MNVVVHIRDQEVLRMLVTMFYDQGLLVEPFVRVIPVISVTASNFMGCDNINPLFIFMEEINEEDIVNINCYHIIT